MPSYLQLYNHIIIWYFLIIFIEISLLISYLPTIIYLPFSYHALDYVFFSRIFRVRCPYAAVLGLIFTTMLSHAHAKHAVNDDDCIYFIVFLVLLEISKLLNTGLDMESLSICVRLCEQGINPEALSSVIKELRKASDSLKVKEMMF